MDNIVKGNHWTRLESKLDTLLGVALRAVFTCKEKEVADLPATSYVTSRTYVHSPD